MRARRWLRATRNKSVSLELDSDSTGQIKGYEVEIEIARANAKRKGTQQARERRADSPRYCHRRDRKIRSEENVSVSGGEKSARVNLLIEADMRAEKPLIAFQGDGRVSLSRVSEFE